MLILSVLLKSHQMTTVSDFFLKIFPLHELYSFLGRFSNNHITISLDIVFIIYVLFLDTATRKVLADHKPIADSYSIAAIDPHWCREVKTYTGIDCVQWFLSASQQVSKSVKKFVAFTKSMPMNKLTAEEELRHLLATKCFYVDTNFFQEFDEAAKKQAEHCNITGQYHGPECKYCNLKNLTLIMIPNSLCSMYEI